MRKQMFGKTKTRLEKIWDRKTRWTKLLSTLKKTIKVEDKEVFYRRIQ